MKALYIGSFDPFTNGHYEIIKQAQELFDLHIVIAVNSEKKRNFSEAVCIKAMEPFIKKPDQIYCLTGMTAPEIMKELKCDYLIRGLRNTTDWLYEESLYNLYKVLDPNIKVMYLRTDNCISSSFVRELHKMGKDISQYVPYNPDKLSLLKAFE